MSREHKYRAWIDGEMIYIKDDISIEFYNAKMAVDWSIRSRVDGHSIYKHDSSYPDSCKLNELMEWTGLTDKNGKEIYEGDVVTTKQSYIKPIAVYWNDAMTGFYPLLSERGDKLEVIGNIHQDPQLLK